MKRNPRPWTDKELALLGTRPDAEVAELTGRTFGTVWQKRRALGIAQPALQFRRWTPAEDKLVGTGPDAEIARQLDRTESAVKSRRAILERERPNRHTKPIISDPKPCRAVRAALGVQPIAVPRRAIQTAGINPVTEHRRHETRTSHFRPHAQQTQVTSARLPGARRCPTPATRPGSTCSDKTSQTLAP